MKFRGLISILIMSLMFACVSAAGITPVASRGILDLRNIENREKFVYQLNGEWEFYWGKMLNPTDFVNPYKYKPDCYGKVPSYWTDYSSAMVETTGMGFATYKLTVLLPKGFNRALGFDMPVFDSSYDIYINNQYMTGNGVPGRVESETRPWYEKVFFKYVPSSDTLSIIINVANFHHRRGGFWMPVKMGTFPEVQTHLAASWARDWAAISLLLGFSLFFLFFFIIYPKDRLIGFFSMATIGLALRPLFTSNFLIQNIVPMGWVWTIRLEYIGLYLILTGWYWFTKNLYPTKYFRIIHLLRCIRFDTFPAGKDFQLYDPDNLSASDGSYFLYSLPEHQRDPPKKLHRLHLFCSFHNSLGCHDSRRKGFNGKGRRINRLYTYLRTCPVCVHPGYSIAIQMGKSLFR
jgi:hypothetical protein